MGHRSVAQGTTSEPIRFEIFAQDGPSGPPHNPDRQWGHFKLAASENWIAEHVAFQDLLPRDVASGASAPGATVTPGGTLEFAWTENHVQSDDVPALVFEQNVRIRTSIDGGQTFDAGASYAIAAGSAIWTAATEYIDRDLVLRVEFLDPFGRAIGWDDFDDYRVSFAFDNASATSGISIPQGSTPYASAPVDYDEDGDQDLIVSFEDLPARLYRNNSSFEDMGVFSNEGNDLGPGDVGNTKGVNFADIDNNGTIDLFFASSYGSQLYSSDTDTPGDLTADWSATLGTAGTAPSSAGAFGDFNSDGFLDLYLVRDSSDALLQAEYTESAVFEGYTDVTVAAGLHTETPQTGSATWADIDWDGDQDLFVTWTGEVNPSGGSDPDWCFYYLNLGEQGSQVVFDDVTGAGSGPRIAAFGNVHAVEFADLNGDNALDIVLARQLAAPGDGLPNLLVRLNDGNGALIGIPPADFGLDETALLADVEITDLDGNGLSDVLALPTDGSSPLVRLGYDDAGDRKHFDGTAAAALGSGLSFGLSSADFNGDTDPDIFILRPEVGSTKAFLYANPRLSSPPSAGNAKFLTVRFNAMANGVNRLGLGARVTATVQTPGGEVFKSTQVVDGGSGRGSQGSSSLTFGLGGASTAGLKVEWPNGTDQWFPNAASLPGFPKVVLSYTVDPEIDPASISDSYTPGSTVVHEFSWWTRYAGGEPQVLLTIANPASANCKAILGGGTQLLLKAGVGGVSIVSVPMNGGVQHRLLYETTCFAICNYTYRVRNNLSGAIYSSASYTVNVGVCGGFSE